MNPWILGGSAIAAGLLGWWLGTNYVEGQWAKADKAALELQQELDEEAARKLKESEDALNVVNKRLAERETKLLEISTELNEAINREPTISTQFVEVPGECAPVRVIATDPAAFVRLFNAAITASPHELRDSLVTSTSYDPLWRPSNYVVSASSNGNH